ncbi:MAG: alpha/beta hydrolase [Chakrabartia sp.]
MASEDLAQLLGLLRAGGPDLGAPPLEARAAFEALLANLPVADDLGFTPETLGGVPALRVTAPNSAADRALLYLHGGAFVVGSAQGYRGLAGDLARAGGLTGFAIDYRLAPETPFPGAVEDAAVAYLALLDKGFAPDKIVLAGDSAGGGLTLSTLVQLRDAGHPLPACALLISPWADLGCTGGSITSKQAEDPSLTAEALRKTAAHYLGDTPAQTPLASPIHADLSGLPPLLIQVGSAEILLDDAVRVASVAGHAGTAVRLDIWPDMVHVWHAFAFMLAAGRAAIADAGVFFTSHIKGN